MSGHNRRRSWGSIFSFDGIRSLSRAGSRQAIRLYDEKDSPPRSHTSLSHAFEKDPTCNNLEDLPAAAPFKNPSVLALEKKESLKRSATDPTLQSIPYHEHVSAREHPLSHRRRRSRFSWMSLSKSSLSKSHERSSLTRSVISSPVLTSTTNAKVARQEGVQHGHLSQSDLSQSGSNVNAPASTSRIRASEIARKIDTAIKDMTGHPRSKRRSVYDNKEALQIGKVKKDESELLLRDMENAQPEDFTLGRSFRNENRFRSLSRSFASAVDKLDSHQSQKKTTTDIEEPFTTNSNNSTGYADQNAKNDLLLASQGVLSGNPYQHVSRFVPTKLSSNIQTSNTGPCTYSFEKSKIVESPNLKAEQYPTGVNPLGCHHDTLSLAKRPEEPKKERNPFESPPASLPRIKITREEDNELVDGLEDAVIYSPSIGDLSSYARQTPSPARSSYESPRKPTHHGFTTMRNNIQDTPTRAPGKIAGGDENGPSHNMTSHWVRENVSGLLKIKRNCTQKLKERMRDYGDTQKAISGQPGALQDCDRNQKVERDTGYRCFPSQNQIGDDSSRKFVDCDDSASSCYTPKHPSPLRSVTNAERQLFDACEKPWSFDNPETPPTSFNSKTYQDQPACTPKSKLHIIIGDGFRPQQGSNMMGKASDN